MVMEQFNIIGAFETYALSKGWVFVYGFNNFESNIQVMHDYSPDQLVLIADFKADPRYSGANVAEITYTCLIMLGRKFDLTGLMSSLDESAKQKYDRRLKELAQYLAVMIGSFACTNELTIQSAPIKVDINLFDTNIDFAISENAIFIQ
jgi:hypothetical protein